ncbi:MAG: gluconate 2-dehydrogenase subunit 3 family protein [Acidobacteriia bacterium]|nr:gluconate 2-dehydrogenase subunit 3 family protein [Terriglobia bacterium]
MSEDRRDALKIIGSIGATCAFPFSADELYGQHSHGLTAVAQAALPSKPQFLTAPEMKAVARLADLIIPATDTPGALAAGVPAYIDLVISRSRGLQKLCREGLAWLNQETTRVHARPFVELNEQQQISVLEPLCKRADRTSAGESSPEPLEVEFFRAMKNMTADGYFTSRAGLIEELGYQGNTVLAEFPACTHEH